MALSFEAIPYAVDVMRRVVDGMFLVSEREIAEAIAACASAGLRVEGAAAAAIAAIPRAPDDGPVVAIVTGRNIDEEIYRRALSSPETFGP